MSDPLSGGSGSDGPKVTAEIEFVVKNIREAVAIVAAASKTMEKDIVGLDNVIDAVSASLKIMATEARTAFQAAKAEAQKATTETLKAKNALTKTEGKNQTSKQEHLEIMKNLQLQGNAANNTHARYMQNSKTRSQTSSQNFKTAYQEADILFKQGTQTHQQQMAALKSTNQISKQNHDVTMINLKNQGQLHNNIFQASFLGLRNTMQLSRQNHQVTMAQLRQQYLATKQAAGGGMGGMLAGVGKVAGGLLGGGGGLGAVAGTIAGGFAGGALVQGVTSVTNAMIQGVAAADELARTYARQDLAGRTLAGTQEDLNELLETYDEATGEALGKSKQLAGVVRLQAVGFADSQKELDEFARAIRGISLSIGEPADYVTQNLILELFSQRGQRLDQLGLQYDDVRERQEALMQSDKNLTKQQAYQQAVLDQALDRYGQLADSTEGQATGVEKLGAAWSDFGLAISQLITGPLDGLVRKLAEILDGVAAVTSGMSKVNPDNIEYKVPKGGYSTSSQLGGITPDVTTYGQSTAVLNSAMARKAAKENESAFEAMLRGAQSAIGVGESMEDIDRIILQAKRNLAAIDVARMKASGYKDTTPGGATYNDNPKPKAFTDDQEDEIRSFSIARRQIESDTNAAILEENTEYGQRRQEIERDYQQQVAEEAQDFARQRARDEADFQKEINNVMMDSAKKQLEIQEDLAKSIAKLNRDHAKEMEKAERDHARDLKKMREDAGDDEKDVQDDLKEKQAEAIEDSGEKIVEMEEEFARDRAKAARAHNESILQSAAQLDAAGVYWEQKKFAREEKEAQEEQDRKVAKEKEGLEKELKENEEASVKRITEIKKNLQEEIDESNEAHKIRIADANEAHAQQLADQQAAAAERIAEVIQEDADRLAEMVAGHAARLSEEDTDRGIRLGREKTHHDNQLGELDRVHGLRITQIGTQAEAERTKLDEEHRQKMLDLGFQQGQWLEADRRARNIALKEHELFLKEDAYLDIEARKALMTLKRNDPATSPEEAAKLGESIGYLNNELIALGPSINALKNEIAALPQPQTDLLPSSPDQEVNQSSVFSAAGGVDLGPWTGKITNNNIGGAGVTKASSSSVSFVIEAGAITITPLPGQSAAAVGDDFEERLLRTLRKVAKTG